MNPRESASIRFRANFDWNWMKLWPLVVQPLTITIRLDFDKIMIEIRPRLDRHLSPIGPRSDSDWKRPKFHLLVSWTVALASENPTSADGAKIKSATVCCRGAQTIAQGKKYVSNNTHTIRRMLNLQTTNPQKLMGWSNYKNKCNSSILSSTLPETTKIQHLAS